MKKNLLTFVTALLATGVPVCAQEMTLLDNLSDSVGTLYQPTAEAISSNHRYLTGPAVDIAGNAGMFVYDLETNKYAVAPAVDYYGADMRAVSDDGVSIGYNGPGITYSIDGTVTVLEVPEGYASIPRDADDDLSVIVGNYSVAPSYTGTKACIWRNGKIEDLPLPADEDLGFDGSTAYYVSADGSVIAGYVGNGVDNALVVWRLQSDGSYKYDLVYKNYLFDDNNPEKPYIVFSPSGMSRNGRYVALLLATEDVPFMIGRLDLVTNELETYAPDGTNDIPREWGINSSAIADDGTVVGWVLAGDWMMQQRRGMIWCPGEKPKLLADMYPELSDIATFDMIGFNTICDITPDARYIAGFAYDEFFNNRSFVIDRGENLSTGINNTAAKPEGDKEAARYTVGGTAVNQPVKGINIIKKVDGTTVKVLVK